ncbi:Putative restriction endonuclease [Herminiimonas arsenicoxydans]|uniref:Restriction endonuclease n=1 Tax=Herminiimonas arsenicoxydans TaxID=204773 RepID=A4G160_HERAR|nr:Putative restriction endonuclease [Herminiimonas arsenicoxydans]
MVSKSNNWNRDQLLVAFNLYCQIPFGKMHSRNPEIIRLATLIGRTPSALAMKLTNIASLDPAITSTGRRGLAGASAADKLMWNEMQHDWEGFALESQAVVDAIVTPNDINQDALLPTAVLLEEEEFDYSAEDKTSMVKIRVGQHFFRRSVLSAYLGRCCITGLAEPRLLVASHIVPWHTDSNHRLNPRNGLCLSVLHDKAFDLGMFTLTPDFKIKTSRHMQSMSNNPFATDWLVGLEGKCIELPEKFRPELEFLHWHHQNIFMRE